MVKANPSSVLNAARRANWIPAIGLEIHAQINTKTKLFSASPNDNRGGVNENVSPFDAGIPGTLPVLNRECVRAGVLTAKALNCRLNRRSTFDRKHYFYADLPSGYQITQQRLPLAVGGRFEFPVLKSPFVPKTYSHSAEIVQLQLEMDSGKSVHDEVNDKSLIDLNRAGVGLMEIVFAPDLSSGEESAALVRELIATLKTLATCTCQMESGALRVDANVSVKRPDQARLGTRTEIKNLNSLRRVRAAVEAEIDRQIEVLESGGEIVNETRSFDAAHKVTLPMRDKEVRQDYRFMPEPNLPPLWLEDEDVRIELPELPVDVRRKYVGEFGLGLETTCKILRLNGYKDVFEECLRMSDDKADKETLAEVILMHKLQDEDESYPVKPEILLELNDLNGKLPETLIKKALEIFSSVEETSKYKNVGDLIQEKNWSIQSAKDEEKIAEAIKAVLSENESLVKRVKKELSKGKSDTFTFKKLLNLINSRLNDEMEPNLVKSLLQKELLHHLK